MNTHQLTEQVTHFCPEPNGSTRAQRVAVCGEPTRIGGSIHVPPVASGTSNRAWVTCCACLDVLEARKRIQESGDV